MAVGISVMTLTVGAPPVIGGREGRLVLADFYCALLGMVVIREDWLKIATSAGAAFHLALDGDGWSDRRPPRWGDPEHPQQFHIDVLVPDLDAAGALVEGMGASSLQHTQGHRVYADPAGHPFCLYADQEGPRRVGRVVIDCFSPRHLATFHEGLLESGRRVEDTSERVVLDLDDDRFPHLAFQHAEFVAARWPDPAFPAQFHFDFRFADKEAAVERAARLGGIRLPTLSDSEVFADPAAHPFCI